MNNDVFDDENVCSLKVKEEVNRFFIKILNIRYLYDLIISLKKLPKLNQVSKEGDLRQNYLKTLDDIETIRYERDRLLSSNIRYKKVVESASEQMKEFKEKIQENFLKECQKLKDSHNSSFIAFKNESFQKMFEKDQEILRLKDSDRSLIKVELFYIY